jgi:Holliday junction resolvase RusA-like endonuclease
MYGSRKNGTKYLLPKTKRFYDASYFEIYHQLGKIPKFYKKVTMLIEYFPRRNGGWDASNFRKAPEDAIVKAGVIPDDQVKYLQPQAPVIHKRVKREEQPYIKITLEEI